MRLIFSLGFIAALGTATVFPEAGIVLAIPLRAQGQTPGAVPWLSPPSFSWTRRHPCGLLWAR